jgi:predicted phage terminase large subunit-like protein
MDRAKEWLFPTAARWREASKTWTFPSGATLSFGYLEHTGDEYRYQSTEFQFIAFDELTQFEENQYRYMFSRLRRPADSVVPLRMRTASNPGGVGHEWVRGRFIDGDVGNDSRIFISARLPDNPYLDQEAYVNSLNELDPITRRQLLDGDWTARQAGNLFQREWFPVVEDVPVFINRSVRYWDLAATPKRAGSDPDYTAGIRIDHATDGLFYVVDVQRMRGTPADVERRIAQTAAIDGNKTSVVIEQEPGASGVNTIYNYVTRVIPEYTVRGQRSTGSKLERAGPVSSQAEVGNIRLLRGPWIGEFLDELEAFPYGGHDDQVDALSGAFMRLRSGQTREPAIHQLVGARRIDPVTNPLGLDPNNPKYWDR